MKLQVLHEEQVDYRQITQLVARKHPHPLRPGNTIGGVWMVMLGDLHIANIIRKSVNFVAPTWDWQFKRDIPRYIYHPLIRDTLDKLTKEIEHAAYKGPTIEFTAIIGEALNSAQLDAVIKDIKPRLKDSNFSPAVRKEMQRHGYGYNNDIIFKQIGGEMRRRSALVRGRKSKAKNLPARPEYGDLGGAIEYANREFQRALIGSPDIDSINKSDYAEDAAARFNVPYQDVIRGMK